MQDRRGFFGKLSAIGVMLGSSQLLRAQNRTAKVTVQPPESPLPPRSQFLTPDLGKLPFRLVDGVKEFHLISEVVTQEIAPGRKVTAWGYNGSIPGPTIEANEGDRIRVIYENRLPEMSAVHWHGLEAPMEMDGSVGLGMDPIGPGGKYVYEFTLRQHGTLFYHSHFPMQEMMGMVGFFIVHPKEGDYKPRVDHDFGLILQEWALLPNNDVPNSLAMEFNWLTFNGVSGPACTPMVVKQGERVRIRLVNLGMDHHPIHLHGHQFVITGTEAARKPEATWFEENTVIVGVAQARTFEFVAKNKGDWMIHCHLPHHMMNQMVSMVGPMMSHGSGPQIGGMTEGMGMIRQGNALAGELGPAFGRTIGGGGETPTSTVMAQNQDHQHHQQHQHADSKDPDKFNINEHWPKDDPERKKVAGYPQDMWMNVDGDVKPVPEHLGLRPGWTGGMMGMMTMIRVVDEATYAKIEEMRKATPTTKAPAKSAAAHEHHHED
jgi:manganese oxidase